RDVLRLRWAGDLSARAEVEVVTTKSARATREEIELGAVPGKCGSSFKSGGVDVGHEHGYGPWIKRAASRRKPQVTTRSAKPARAFGGENHLQTIATANRRARVAEGRGAELVVPGHHSPCPICSQRSRVDVEIAQHGRVI